MFKLYYHQAGKARIEAKRQTNKQTKTVPVVTSPEVLVVTRYHSHSPKVHDKRSY